MDIKVAALFIYVELITWQLTVQKKNLWNIYEKQTLLIMQSQFFCYFLLHFF